VERGFPDGLRKGLESEQVPELCLLELNSSLDESLNRTPFSAGLGSGIEVEFADGYRASVKDLFGGP